MNFNKIKNRIKEAFIVSGYSRTAKILLELSDRQLADIGVSRALLRRGVSAYPWRDAVVSLEIPNNLTTLKTTKVYESRAVTSRRPKAA